jgi:arabinose-5-phosphate isomerase
VEIIQKSTMQDLAKEVFQIEADSILKLKNRINQNLDEALDVIIKSKGRVIVTGMGKSGLIGRKIAATLSSTGTPSYFLHPAESTHGDSGIITREDVVIAISNSGETSELLNLLPLIKRFEVPLIVLSGKQNSTLGRCADIYFDIS